MKTSTTFYAYDGQSEEKLVCCFCKKQLVEDYFADDTGRVFCDRLCRQKRIEELKKFADKERTV